MRREAGVSVVAVVAVLAVLAAAGTGYLPGRTWRRSNCLQSELSTAKSGLDKARADLKKAAQELAAASKDAKESKAAAERLATERDQVRTSMENSQANGDRLRAELALAKDQISYLSARSSKDVVKGMPKVATSR